MQQLQGLGYEIAANGQIYCSNLAERFYMLLSQLGVSGEGKRMFRDELNLIVGLLQPVKEGETIFAACRTRLIIRCWGLKYAGELGESEWLPLANANGGRYNFL